MDALQALMYPSVNTLRASSDFFTGKSWDVGMASLLLWALDLTPSVVRAVP